MKIQTLFNIAQSLTLGGALALAISVNLGVALVSLSKATLLLGTCLIIGLAHYPGLNTINPQIAKDIQTSLKRAWSLTSTKIILACLLWMLISAIWSISNTHDWMVAWIRHARLLVFPLIVFCLANQSNAVLILRGLVVGQTFVLICSWLLWLGVPYIMSNPLYPRDWGIVINGHLEQPIMTSLMVVCVWTLKEELFPNLNQKWIFLLCALSVGNVFFIMNGRTGFVSMLVAMTCALYFWYRKKFKVNSLLIAIAPICLVITLVMISPRFLQRAVEVKHDIDLYSQGNDATSQGYRIDYWVQSFKSIHDSPLLGTGVGSWRQDYVSYGGNEPNPPSNPHQQFLLWFVESGLIGLILILCLYASFFKDAKLLSTHSKEAMLTVSTIALVVSMFNCPFYGAGMGEFFLLLLGALVALGHSHQPSQSESVTNEDLLQLTWIESLGLKVITQPLSQKVPGNELNYCKSEGLKKLGWRYLRKSIYLNIHRQNALMVDQSNSNWKKGLWIYHRTAQIGDSLMDLAARSLFRQGGIEIDLLTPTHLCEVFHDDPYFSGVYDDIEQLDINKYDFVIIQSVHHRSLKQKIRYFPRLPWICIQGFYDVPDFARSKWCAQRLIDIFDWTKEQNQIDHHAHPKLGVTHIGSNIHFNNTEVTLVIGGIDPTRTYHQWDQVVIELKKHGIHQCVLIGTGEYAQQEAFKIKQELGSQLDIVNLVNKTSMQECIQLLQNTQTLLTADGGMMHMGVACGIPKIVSLFTKGIDAAYRLPQVHLEGAIQGQSSQINDIDPAIIIERFKRLQQLQRNHLK